MSLKPGMRLGPYEIQAAIGSGGMGEVYKAVDRRLDREVAIKILPAHLAVDPAARVRFEREARLVASLSDPNVVVLHDVGVEGDTPFVVMELLDGETLREHVARGRVPWRRAVEIALGAAQGLAAAHARGIVHRDLKPENVLLTKDGHVKVLDFGVARPIAAALPDEGPDATMTALTEAGAVVGTVGYMSPEQLRGGEADVRSDIFALGCILYELLTGRRAFGGRTQAETMAAVLTNVAPRATDADRALSPDLDRILAHCLEKNPRDRFQAATDLALALRALLAGSSGSTVPSSRRPVAKARGKSLAILPFENLSGDRESEYLSDGLTETVINNLSQLPRLHVMARSTVFRYKGRRIDPQRVGRDLGVRAVVTGRVLLRGDALIVSAEMMDVEKGWQLWGAQYNRRLSDIFAVQEEIAREITENLKLRLSGEERKRLVARATENVAAYQEYLKGRYHWNRRTDEGFQKAQEFFQQAIAIDPGYALAHAGLADAFALRGIAEYGSMPPAEAMPRARAAALKALELDDRLAEAHTTLAHVAAFFDWRWAEAEQAFRLAIEINPRYAFAHHWNALYLAAMGRAEDAIASQQRALEIEPLSLIINKNVGTVLYYARHFDRAIEQYLRTLQLDAAFVRTHLYLGLAYVAVGRFDEATAALRQAIAGSPENPVLVAALGHAHARAGRRDEALTLLERLQTAGRRRYVGAFNLALIHAGLADADATFECLSRAYDERSSWLVSLNIEPLFDDLRADPRFAALAGRVGLPGRASSPSGR